MIYLISRVFFAWTFLNFLAVHKTPNELTCSFRLLIYIELIMKLKTHGEKYIWMKIAMGIWIKGGKYVSKIFFSKLQFWYLPSYSDSSNCIFLLHRHISADEIVCKLYDLRLDVFDGHCYNGGRVGCCRRTGNSNQRWHFEGIIIIIFTFILTYHFFIIIFRVKI